MKLAARAGRIVPSPGFGGISVGGIEPNKKPFAAQLLPQVDHLPHTHDLSHNAFAKGQPAWERTWPMRSSRS